MNADSRPTDKSSRTRLLPRLFSALLVIVLVLLGMVGVVLQDEPRPALTVHFTGKISPGLHVNPFADFTITNVGNRAVFWSRGEVEAPTDTNVALSAMFDSNMAGGRLEPGALTNFPAIVPNVKGAPFRILVSYQAEPGRLDRIHQTLVRAMPLINQVWARTNDWLTSTSRWYRTVEDYTNGMTALEQAR